MSMKNIISIDRARNDYVKRAGVAMLDVVMIHDHAVSAEKMLSWQCVGENNPAWEEGPHICSGRDLPKISRDHPYVLRVSKEMQMTVKLVLNPDHEDEKRGKIAIPERKHPNVNWKSEPALAKLAIIEQFEIYKEFALAIGGPFSLKTSRNFLGRLDPVVIDALRDLTDRRNEVTHSDNYIAPTMREAIEYFYVITWVALEVSKVVIHDLTSGA